MNVRIIPKLEIKGPNLVKGVRLEGLRVLGKPWQFARYYYEHGADELFYQDVVASLYGRNSLTEIVSRTAREIFIPLTVGGGLRSIEDMNRVLKSGADKVAINTAAVNDPELVEDAARKFGSSTIVVSIEAKKRPDGSYEAYTDNGRIRTEREVVEWAKEAAERGAGELLITSIDRDGTGEGLDMELVSEVIEVVDVPVIACGGAGSADHVWRAVEEAGAAAVAVASLLHYNYVRDFKLDDDAFTEEGNIEFLRGDRGYSHVASTNLPELKEFLLDQEVQCRPAHQSADLRQAS